MDQVWRKYFGMEPQNEHPDQSRARKSINFTNRYSRIGVQWEVLERLEQILFWKPRGLRFVLIISELFMILATVTREIKNSQWAQVWSKNVDMEPLYQNPLSGYEIGKFR